MQKFTKMGVTLFVLFFVIVTSYNNYEYHNTIEQADALFTQTESEFINNWYESNEQQQNITQENQNDNAKGWTNYAGGESGEAQQEDPLANLVVPTFTSGVQAYMFAENVLNQANGIHIESTGTARASIGVEQEVLNIRKEDNQANLYAYNATYGSFYKMGFEAYYNQRQFKTRTTSAVRSDLTSDFKNNWAFSSVNAYAKQYGNLPNELNYIVNETTVLEESNFKFENGLYSFTLKLSPTLSTQRYQYNVRTNRGSSDLPKFESITLQVVINQQARFQSIHYAEKYSIAGMGVTTSLTEVFKVIHGQVVIEPPSGF